MESPMEGEEEELSNFRRQSLTVTNTDEEVRELPVLQRLQFPLIWARLSTGIRIQDLKENQFTDAISVIKASFFHEEVLCKTTRLADDEKSVEGYLEHIHYWMEDGASVVAVHEGSGLVVGVMLGIVVSRLFHTRTYSRICLIQGEALEKLMKYQWHIHKKANVFERFNVDDYYRVCLLSILPEYRGLGIGMGFMITAEKMTRLMGLTVLTGIFTNASSQNLASKIGMENVFELAAS
ncbi:uncharacterized protein LOC126336172 isoform X2 [Schistocerca gregaria]|uniref:uncharacterized protein LOC126336172 isoform X2 n=1 Tax=Schistocerca gregaria TaxID=7010 RepID=UPI00211E9D25|nr:uncharacterized protein LOC126336172 isoform X2 [Schistocerca gregaria]